MIRDGATLVRGVEDVLEQIAPALRARAVQEVGTIDGRDLGNPADMEILELLAGGAVSVDELIRNSGRPVSEILASVLDLELRGAIRQLPGRQFQLTGRFAGVGGLQ